MFNNKYGNILTMILIILAVTIVGIIGYFAYDTFHTKQVNDNAQMALEEFKRATTKVSKKKTTTVGEDEKTNTVANTTDVDQTIADYLAAQNTVEEPVVQDPGEEESTEPEPVYMEGYEIIGELEIPKTNVDYPVLERLTKKTLEIALAYTYGPGLNKPGNTIIYGHNYRNNSFFSNNKKLAKGDKVYITDKYENRVEYTIYNIYETTANDAEYIKRDTAGRREISLQTCTDSGNGRIIIWATADPIE